MVLVRDESGALPMMVIVVIIGAVLLFTGLIVLTITLGTILALVLVGAGLYLLVKPEKLAGMTPTLKTVVPLVLIVLGVAVYTGWLKV